MSNIFREFAPLYWGAGIPAIPLKPRQKMPILNEWTSYGENMPIESVRQHWLSTYPNSNIGLPFGPASGLCAIDVDTLDEAQVTAIESVIGKSPWIRIGKKGYAAVFKWQGQRNFKIRDAHNQSIVEFLGFGNQLVLPPSIHPDTGEAYTANTSLWEVMDRIPALGVDIEDRLRSALGVAGFTLSHEGRSKPLDVVPSGERDIQLVRHAGYLSRVVLGIDKNQKFTLKEAIDQMYHWVEVFTASVAGDDMDPNKGVSKLLEFLTRDVAGGRVMPDGWDIGLSEEQLAHPTIAALVVKNEQERWTFSRAKEWFAEQLSQRPGDEEWQLSKVEELIGNVAKDENFSELTFKALVDVIQRATPTIGFKRPDLVRMFKECRKGSDDMAQDHEQIARFVIEDLNRGGEVRFHQGSFWQWNGSCFGRLETEQILEHIGVHVKDNPLAKRMGDYTALTKLVSMLTKAPLDETNEHGINFANGFLDVEGVLHDHSPKFGATFTMPFNYVPARAGEAHKWFAYLKQAWGQDPDYEEKVMALQEAFAATMFGVAPRYQRAILLHGRPHTGKTQALEVLQSMMPPAASASVGPEKWGERFQLTALVGKALNVCGELPEAAFISGSVFKQVLGGEEVNTEYKGMDSFDFRPKAAHWFASNHLPRSRDTSPGFSRRWLVLDFNRVITSEEKIPDFHQILVAEEREAIAAWAVEGMKRLLENRAYTMPESARERENEILRSNNSVAAFIQSSERVVVGQHDCDVQHLFDEYLQYMKHVSRGNGVSFETFRNMLGDLGHTTSVYRDPLGVMRFKTKGVALRETINAVA